MLKKIPIDDIFKNKEGIKAYYYKKINKPQRMRASRRIGTKSHRSDRGQLTKWK